MYKLTRPDGFDFYSGTINYREAIGSIIRVTDYDPPPEVCGKGLHASKNPNDCFVGAKIPCAAFRVKGIQPIARDSHKTRYQALKVIEEITDLDNLFGWRYSEAINPIHPFKITPPTINTAHIQLLKKWVAVRDSVGEYVMDSVGNSVMDSVVGDSVGEYVMDSVWNPVFVRDSVENPVWNSARDAVVRASVGYSVFVRDAVWAYTGSLFSNIKKWKYINHKKGEYPYQPAVDLWKQGLVPSFDGKTWRLHGGPKADILWKGII